MNVKFFGACAMMALAGCNSKAETKTPNIVFILADDMGYGDVSALNPGSKIHTPNIDRIAGKGVTFTGAHSGSAVSTPTRYGILTGRYSWRTTLKSGTLNGYSKALIPQDRLTMAGMLQQQGYQTACFGKWHLGWDWANIEAGKENIDYSRPVGNAPITRGFDYFYGISASLDMPPYVYLENDMPTTVPDRVTEGNNIPAGEEGYDGAMWRKGPTGSDFDHAGCLSNLNRRVMQYINENAKSDKPFFLYYPMPSPHTPILPSKEFQGKSGLSPYGDFVMMVDHLVGEVVQALEKNGILDNTILVFTSDNGIALWSDIEYMKAHGHYPSYIYRGNKADLYDGGHHIPCMVQWPARIKPHTVNQTICLNDFMATFADLTGYRLKDNEAEDSFSLLPALFDENYTGEVHEAVVHHSGEGYFAIRKGQWKLLMAPGSGGWSYPRPGEEPAGSPPIQLFDMNLDEGEKVNVQDKYPEVAAEMKALLIKYILDGRSAPGAVSRSTRTFAKEPVDYVDPFIGTSTSTGKAGVLHGMGKTFPGAATPFGLVQLSPNTITGKDHGPGYSYEHPSIKGFAFLQMSGIGWGGDLGNFLVMPATGGLKTSYGKEEQPGNGYRSRYDKATEHASAGYYDVTLTDYNIRTELTAAPHSGILRFTYPENPQSRIQIDLARRVGGTSVEQYVKVMDEYTIAGWMKCTPDGGGWGNGRGKADYTVHFYCRFDRPLETFGVWSANIPDGWARKIKEVTSDVYQELAAQAEIIPGCREMRGKHLGFFTEFPTAKNMQVLMKCGISLVSIEGAKANLEAEIPGWDFDRVHSQARQLWSDALSVIRLEGGTDDRKTIFYTGLYHTMIDPRKVSDVNGNYRGADGVHQTGNFEYRSIFSGWDVFRSQFPLQTLINPEMVNDEINSLITLAGQSGKQYYPRWELLNAYTGCMIGTPAIPVIVGAYEKGIRKYDVEKAFLFAKNTADIFSNNADGYSPGSLSETLEYMFGDWCVGRFAERLGKTEDARKYYDKSLLYVNSYDPEVQWMRTRKSDGSWLEWEGKTVHGQGCKESNPYQQGWFVPHDVQGLINVMGKEHFEKELITFFEKTPDNFNWNDYYNHPNEPVHHVAFMFTYTGLPYLTQKWSRKICDNAYGIGVYGLKGNEDVGQMSAWYILAAMGFHPVNPADEVYIIGSPIFDKVTLHLDPAYYTGKEFVITARQNSLENIYIQSAVLNGKPLSRAWLLHSEIVSGGTLELQMGPEPNKEWGAGKENLPPSQSKE